MRNLREIQVDPRGHKTWITLVGSASTVTASPVLRDPIPYQWPHQRDQLGMVTRARSLSRLSPRTTS
jgi:hypothetical protein